MGQYLLDMEGSLCLRREALLGVQILVQVDGLDERGPSDFVTSGGIVCFLARHSVKLST